MEIGFPFPFTKETANRLLAGDGVSAWNDIRIEELGPEGSRARMTVEKKHVAPNGFLHASVVLSFADITSGIGTALHLPGPDHIFATIEIQSNFTGTATAGDLICQARPRHLGRQTQVWDAEVSEASSGRLLALFRCTQMVLPRPDSAD